MFVCFGWGAGRSAAEPVIGWATPASHRNGSAEIVDTGVTSPSSIINDSNKTQLMDHPEHLATQIERTVTGPMWHGPALNDVLAGVTSERAAAHLVAGAHSIWEIVRHVIVWTEIARARLKGGRRGDPAPEEDWAPVSGAGPGDWKRTLDRLHSSHRELATDARRMDAAQLHVTLSGLDYSAAVRLHGVVEHGAYHGGQIALLKKT